MYSLITHIHCNIYKIWLKIVILVMMNMHKMNFEGVLKPYSFEPKRQDREINVTISESTSHRSDNDKMAVNEIW